MNFTATLAQHGKTATGIEVPAEVIDALGAGKRAKVLVTINGHTYRSSIGSMGGRSLIPVSAEVRAAARITAGDTIKVQVVLDTEPRTVTLPDDLATALAAVPGARQAFDTLPPSKQRRHVLAVTSAKTDQTRHRRIVKIVDELRDITNMHATQNR